MPAPTAPGPEPLLNLPTGLALSPAGDLMFGLSSARVQRAIRALPGATRCDRYCGWPEGEELAAAPLVGSCLVLP